MESCEYVIMILIMEGYSLTVISVLNSAIFIPSKIGQSYWAG